MFIISLRFRLLLEFWKTHYLKRGKDCSALEQVGIFFYYILEMRDER